MRRVVEQGDPLLHLKDFQQIHTKKTKAPSDPWSCPEIWVLPEKIDSEFISAFHMDSDFITVFHKENQSALCYEGWTWAHPSSRVSSFTKIHASIESDYLFGIFIYKKDTWYDKSDLFYTFAENLFPYPPVAAHSMRNLDWYRDLFHWSARGKPSSVDIAERLAIQLTKMANHEALNKMLKVITTWMPHQKEFITQLKKLIRIADLTDALS